jgi:uncharacterized membrane protein
MIDMAHITEPVNKEKVLLRKQPPTWSITKLLAVSSFAACLMLLSRVLLTGSFYYFFLPWNLLLAWLPYMFSLNFMKFGKFRLSWMKVTGLFLAWLIFLPNSPYLLTDLVHLAPRSGIPLWFDALLIVLFAWTGLILGLISIAHVHRYIRLNFPDWLSRCLLLVIIMLCSFGIYVGRILRWNSWDLIVQPLALSKSIAAQFLHPFQHQQTYGMTLSFSLFLGLSYYTLLIFGNLTDHGTKTE